MSKPIPQLLTDFIYAINKHGQVDFNSITVNDRNPDRHVYTLVIYVPDSPDTLIGMKFEIWNQTGGENIPAHWLGWHWQQTGVVGRKYRN